MLRSGLLTDLYQLTMAFGYWQSGFRDREAVFHLFFRKAPFGGSYAICAGLEAVERHLDGFGFSEAELEYLATIEAEGPNRYFSREFLDYLSNLRLSCDIDAVAEGTVVFPHVPIVKVRGSLLECQLLETALLTLINFQTLIATKAARIRRAAGTDQVLEFGLRRAHGIDGGVSASRAAYVGGVDATSNVIAGQLYGIPVKGTHAHSWVMAFDSEREAFVTYARTFPQNCTLLVDTYDTRTGVETAIQVMKEVSGLDPSRSGIRLDSGDLVRLSRFARQRLDAEGFQDAVIVASGDLDETTISRLKAEGAKINVWGIGTTLATGHPQGALGGVYKLGAIRHEAGPWRYVSKRSEQAVKASIAGNLSVDRFVRDGCLVGDVMFDAESSRPTGGTYRTLSGRRVDIEGDSESLLRPLMRDGELLRTDVPWPQSTEAARNKAVLDLKALPDEYRDNEPDPNEYPVGLSADLQRIRELATRNGENE